MPPETDPQGAALPRLEQQMLRGFVLQRSLAWILAHPEAVPSAAEARRLATLTRRRQQGEPMAYVLGQREFYGLTLTVTPATLIPRPETETLVDWALALSMPQPPTPLAVLDLGTGSGAIAVALKSQRPHWRITATDCSSSALAVAQANALRWHPPGAPDPLRLVCGHWFAAVAQERFDLIVANPPYIAPQDPHLSQGDLRFEPSTALVSQAGGLHDLQHLIRTAPEHLSAGGWLLLEHGWEQGPACRALLHAAGFVAVRTQCDLAGLERVSGGCWPAPRSAKMVP